ncbi:MAG: alpha/beta fold hydrolase, partial [Gammaproteobacteria bacterium]
IDEGDYRGGHSRADIEDLLAFLDDNFVAWSQTMAPAIMGNADRPELAAELQQSFCRADPTVARQFARVTFLSDTRAQLPLLTLPTLVLQCSNDAIAPDQVGQYVHEAIPGSTLVRMQASGHCPNMSAPHETIAAIRAFLG